MATIERPRCKAKANPNLGVSVKLDDLQRKCDKATRMPAAQNGFKRLHLDVWTQQSDRWIDLTCGMRTRARWMRRRSPGGCAMAGWTCPT